MKSTRKNGYEYWMKGVRATCPKCYYKSLSHIRPYSNWVYCASDQCDWAGDFTEGLVHKDSPNLTRRNIRFIYLPYLTRSNTQDPTLGYQSSSLVIRLEGGKNMKPKHKTISAERRKSEGLLVENAELRKRLEKKTRQLENFMELYEQQSSNLELVERCYTRRGAFLRREQHETANLRRELEYQKNLYSNLMTELDVLIMQEEQNKLAELKKKVTQ